jgi:hypothetical protein
MSDEYEEFEDDDDVLLFGFTEVEERPLTRFTAVRFFLTLILGIIAAFHRAFDELDTAVVGAEGHAKAQKDFQDDARIAIDSIADGPDSE